MLLQKRFVISLCTGVFIRLYFDHFTAQKTDAQPERTTAKAAKRVTYTSAAVSLYHGTLNYASKSIVTVPISSHLNLSSVRKHAARKQEVQKTLTKQVRVLCWIMTQPSNHEKRAAHIKNTWGKRCNKLIFMSSQSDEKLGAVGLPSIKEGRHWLWAKTKEAFKYVWEHYRDEADWFLRADDDAYVIVENLKLMLSKFDHDTPIYFGAPFRVNTFGPERYMSGGCGYVLSKEALRRFVEQALPDKDNCRPSNSRFEDVEMARCLKAVGVEMGDSRDAEGRYRFFHYPPEFYVTRDLKGCSDVAVSFHLIKPNQMYVLEYFIYHLRIFGSKSSNG